MNLLGKYLAHRDADIGTFRMFGMREWVINLRKHCGDSFWESLNNLGMSNVMAVIHEVNSRLIK